MYFLVWTAIYWIFSRLHNSTGCFCLLLSYLSYCYVWDINVVLDKYFAIILWFCWMSLHFVKCESFRNCYSLVGLVPWLTLHWWTGLRSNLYRCLAVFDLWFFQATSLSQVLVWPAGIDFCIYVEKFRTDFILRHIYI